MKDEGQFIRQSSLPPQMQGYQEFAFMSATALVRDEADGRKMVYMTFFSEDGSIGGMKVALCHLPSIGANIIHSARRGIRTSSNDPDAGPLLMTLETQSFTALDMGIANGNECMLQFWTRFGVLAQTRLGVGMVARLAGSLQTFLASVPNPPPVERYDKIVEGLTTPGHGNAGPESVEYFGESYPRDVVEALGVLTVRANLLDRSLLTLFLALDGARDGGREKEDFFYSMVSIDYRFRHVLGLAADKKLPDDVLKSVKRAIKKGRRVCVRRNRIVHADWKFEEGELRAERRQGAGVDRLDVDVKAEDINSLSADFRVAAMGLLGAAGAVAPKGQSDGISLRTITPSNEEEAIRAAVEPHVAAFEKKRQEFGWKE